MSKCSNNNVSCPYIFDLMAHLRKNKNKAQAIDAAVTKLKKLEAMYSRGEPVSNEIQKSIADLVILCGHNLGFLVPYLFPAYPSDSPLSLMARPYMFALLSMAGNVSVTFRAGRQIGKCVSGDTVLRTPEGDITIAELFESA